MNAISRSPAPATPPVQSARRLLEPLSSLEASAPTGSGTPIPTSVERLRLEGLAPLWADLLTRQRPPGHQAPRVDWPRSALRDARARYLLQRALTERVSRILGCDGISHAIIKGASVRERHYPEPQLRPMADIDLWVGPESRDAAVRTLCKAGLRMSVTAATVSHECTLTDHGVDFDLHWYPLRPGRAAGEGVERLRSDLVVEGGLPLLRPEAELALLLMHPAITKHVNGREARLIRVIDLDRALRAERVDWDVTLRLIRGCGLATAAWATLHWVRALMDTPVPADFVAALAPSPWRRAYLEFWIDRRLTARLAGVPGLVQGAFSLMLQDRAGDAVRALRTLARCRREAPGTLALLRALADRAR